MKSVERQALDVYLHCRMQVDQRSRLRINEVGHSIGPIPCSLLGDRDSSVEKNTMQEQEP
jgi:hypothetical protein